METIVNEKKVKNPKISKNLLRYFQKKKKSKKSHFFFLGACGASAFYCLVKAPIAPPILCAAGQPDRWRRNKNPSQGNRRYILFNPISAISDVTFRFLSTSTPGDV